MGARRQAVGAQPGRNGRARAVPVDRGRELRRPDLRRSHRARQPVREQSQRHDDRERQEGAAAAAGWRHPPPRRDADRADVGHSPLLPRCRPERPRRGVARALRRPQLAHRRRGIGGALLLLRHRARAARRVPRRRHRLGVLAFDGRDLGVPRAAARDLRRDGAAERAERGRRRPDTRPGVQPVAADADHRVHLPALRVPAGARPCARGVREGVRRGRDRAGRLGLAARVLGGPAERDHRRDRAAPAHHRHDDPDRGGAVVPVDRGAAAQRELGVRDQRRSGSAIHAAVGGARPRHHDRPHRARAERVRRRRARRARSPREAADRGVAVATFIIRRMLSLFLVMFVITVVVFMIFFHTPGIDPTRQIAGRNPSAAAVKEIRHQFGLDRPLPVQYVLMMKKIFISRDLVSYSNQGQKIVPEVIQAVPATLSLVIGAAVIWVVMAIAMGMAAAVFRGTLIDPVLMILALIGISMPVFWVGEVANLITQSRWHDTFLFHWVPPLGYTPLTQSPLAWFEGLIIPWITLSILYTGLYARVLRANLLEVQNEDYIRTARAKGLSERRVLLRHTLRTSMITFISLFGLDFGALVAGSALVTEVVFGIHGVGYLTYQSLGNLDLPTIMATVVYGSFFIVAANALVDIAYAWLDPRIRPA